MHPSVRPILKALGDETRYQIYVWLRDADAPATIAETAEHFGLHPNTVRPHLERLRDAGLVELDATPRGGVGRPQHRYSGVPIELGVHDLDTRSDDAYRLLSSALADVCDLAGSSPHDAETVGVQVGVKIADGVSGTVGTADVDAVVTGCMDRLGFGPVCGDGEVTFTECPYRSVAEEHPDVVCSLHAGMLRGVLATVGAELVEFRDLESSGPCAARYG